MDGGHIPKTRQATAPATAGVSRRKPVTRPGLPISPKALGDAGDGGSVQDLETMRRGAGEREATEDDRRSGEGSGEELTSGAAEGSPAEQGALSGDAVSGGDGGE